MGFCGYITCLIDFFVFVSLCDYMLIYWLAKVKIETMLNRASHVAHTSFIVYEGSSKKT